MILYKYSNVQYIQNIITLSSDYIIVGSQILNDLILPILFCALFLCSSLWMYCDVVLYCSQHYLHTPQDWGLKDFEGNKIYFLYKLKKKSNNN